MVKKLAIEGGRPVRKEPFPPRIIFDEEEKKAALRIIEKTMAGNEAIDLYGEGPEVQSYMREFASFFGVKFATAVSSGTAAIHAALGALRLEPGSEVITTPITDPGTVAPILMQNCIPVFADVDYETLNISAESIAERITKKTKVIIPVHLAGQAAEMDSIMEIAKKYNLIVIEDCAQAHGVKYKGRYAGSIGHLGTFSLMAAKHMTSGGQGGMILTNDEKLFWNAKRFADRGKPFKTKNPTNLFLGLNYRMTELQAAIGRVQLKKLQSKTKKRQKVFKELQKAMVDLKAIRFWKTIDGVEPNPWFCLLHYNKEKMRVNKKQCVEAISVEGKGVPLGAHYTTVIYKQTWMKNKSTYGDSHCPWSCSRGRKIDYTNCCPDAERAIDDHMTLFIHEGWTEKEVQDTADILKKVEEAYLK